MRNERCDVCRADITGAVKDRGYYQVGARDICEACWERLNELIKPLVRAKQPFNYEWFERLVADSLEKAVARGKWSTR